MHYFYKITNLRIYIVTYISQIPILYTIGFTQTSMDCLTLTLVAHLCGQLGVLSIRIKNITTENSTETIGEVIKKHQRLMEYVDYDFFIEKLIRF